MARSRVGHFVEAQILKAIVVDYIDESKALAMVDEDRILQELIPQKFLYLFIF